MIDILRIDENGRTEAEFSDPEALHELLASRPAAHGSCLRFIDPHGDTTFNHLQLPVLAAELRAAGAPAPPPLRRRVEALATFVESAAAVVYTYVKFVGD